MTLDELKKQRLEIDRQIRAIENNIASTENFIVSKGRKTMLVLKFRRSAEHKNAKELTATMPASGCENDSARVMCERIQYFISQLEEIQKQLNTDSAV